MADDAQRWGDRTAEKLVVAFFDDQKLNLDHIGLRLRASGLLPLTFEVTGGEDAEDLAVMVRKALKDGACTIISDYNMNGITGHQLLTAVREQDANIPVFLYTGEDNIRQLTDGFRGAYNKLQVPQLIEAVKTTALQTQRG